MGAVRVKIEQLLLDTENPRIGDTSSQHDALQRVIDDQGEKLFELAQSIAADGMSPLDRLLLLKENKGSARFITLEGNRRVAALKLLANPAVLTGLNVRAPLQKRFEELSKNFKRSDVEPLDCFEVLNREAAASWILLRHTGENEGRGVVSWSGHAAARFRGTDPGLQALEFIRQFGNLTEHQRDAIGNNFPITTLDRLLSTPDVRKRIGVEIKDRKLYSALPPEELIKPLRRIVLDLAQKAVRVGSLMKKEQQVEYIDGFDKSDKPNLSKKSTIRAIENIKGSEFTAKPAKAKEKRKSDPSARKIVVAKGAKLNVTDNKAAEIFKELKRLKVEDFPHASAVLLRVFLELSIDHYMDENSIPATFSDPKGGRRDKNLKSKLKDVAAHLVTVGVVQKKDLFGIERAISDSKSPLYIDLLHAYVHNRFVTPKVRELFGAWNDSQKFFETVWS